jgi:hypothetical protein
VPLHIPLKNTTGWNLLGQTRLFAEALTTDVVSIPPADMLFIALSKPAGDVPVFPRFQFNGDTTATNYAAGFWQRSNASTPVTSRTVRAGNTAGLEGNVVGSSSPMMSWHLITNYATSRKVAEIRGEVESGSGNASIYEGWGEWLNTTAQITTVVLVYPSNLLPVGTTFQVYGFNF